MNQSSTLIEPNQFSINIHELNKILFKAPKNSVYLCNNSVYKPNQFNNNICEPNQYTFGFHRSLISHYLFESDIMCQLIRSVLSVLLCLANTLYYFIANVPPACLFERNFQRNRGGMQPNVRGRVECEKPSPTIPQIFPFFYPYPPTIYQFLPKFPFYFLNQIFSNSRIFSEMRIIHFKNNFLGFLWKKSLTH